LDSVSIIVPPYAEPVHLSDMKNHLKVDSSMTEDDALILAQTAAARDVIETATGANVRRNRVMVATTFDLTLEYFPCSSYIEVPRIPLVSVTSITYVDTSGTTQTLSTSVYSVNTAEGRIHLAYGQSWPATRCGYEDRVTVRFIAGTMASFTAVAATDIFTAFGRSFTVGDRVRLCNSGGALPSGLLPNTDYFVIAGPKLSLTSGGSAVDITGAGTGTHFMGLDVAGFQALQAAIKLTVGAMYENRQSFVMGFDHVTIIPAVEALVASQHA
jgi:uncharacterized phiE125 gp8 family phage protein